MQSIEFSVQLKNNMIWECNSQSAVGPEDANFLFGCQTGGVEWAAHGSAVLLVVLCKTHFFIIDNLQQGLEN